jgi:hypothetical protein
MAIRQALHPPRTCLYLTAPSRLKIVAVVV